MAIKSLRMRDGIMPVIALVLAIGSQVSARADEIYTFVVKKQEEKAKSRWTLSEWLETRDKMRLMDLWLAIHSPAPYEYFLGADYRSADTGAPLGTVGSMRVSAAAYATIFGLEIQHQFSPASEWLGLFDFRIFGFHSQGTNITLQAGVRSIGDAVVTRNAVAGGSMTFYLSRHLGLEGLYRHAFLSVPDGTLPRSSGNRGEAGAFIDFSFVRVYGDYYHESFAPELAGVALGESSSSGFILGTRLYF